MRLHPSEGRSAHEILGARVGTEANEPEVLFEVNEILSARGAGPVSPCQRPLLAPEPCINDCQVVWRDIP